MFKNNPELRESMKFGLAVVVIVCVFLGACSWINSHIGLKDDNVAEESLEAIIKEQTGLDIDLSPESPE